MTGSHPPIEPTRPTLNPEAPRIQVRSDIEEPPSPRKPLEPVLERCRKEADRATARRIVKTESDLLTPMLAQAIKDAEEAGWLLGMAQWSGAEEEDALRLLLNKLQAAATIPSSQ
jgi:hypothetical protein